MVSLSKTASSATPATTGTGSPFGDVAPFPFLVLPGRGVESRPDNGPGREVFDAYARREAAPGLAPRQALARALSEEPAAWASFQPPPAPAPISDIATELPRTVRLARPESETAAENTPDNHSAHDLVPAPDSADQTTGSGGKRRMALRGTASEVPFPVARGTTPPLPPFAGLPSEDGPPLIPLAALPPLPPLPTPSAPPPPNAPVILPAAPAALRLAVPRPALAVEQEEIATEDARPSFFGSLRDALAQRRGLLLFALVLLVAFGDISRRKQWGPFAPDVSAPAASATTAPAGSAAASPSAAPTAGQAKSSASASASAAAAPRLAPVVRGQASPAFTSFASKLKISGVFQGQRMRAMINDRVIYAGDWIDFELGVRLVGADYERRCLIIEEGASGSRLEVRY